MHRVRCLFRVLSVTAHYDTAQTVRIAPTYATRNGVQSEENKAFFQSTPSGEGEIRMSSDARAAALLVPGAYVYLDLHQGEPAEDCQLPEGGLRTDWYLAQVLVRPDDFQPTLRALQSTPRADALLGKGWGEGQISMTVNNLAAWPFFAMAPGEGREKDRRRVVIDFSPA